MSEPKNLGMAAAVAGGYLLGRTRKAQVAITAAAMLAGRGLRPKELVAEGVRKVPGIPAPPSGRGDGDGEDQEAAGRSTVSSLAGRGVAMLAEALHQRTAGLTGEPPENGGGDQEPEDSGGDGRDEERPRRRSSGRPAGKPAPRSPRER